MSDHLFKPGQSGNPNGRPKKIRRITRDALADYGNRSCKVKGYNGRTYNEALVESLWSKAIAGNQAALNHVLNRLIGPMPQALNVSTLTTEQIMEVIKAMEAGKAEALPDDSIVVEEEVE